jgi:isoleucyl-tRNA synthetase
MAPFTPFITEFFYQHLRKLQPSYSLSSNGGGSSNPVCPGKSDSVHYLSLPSFDDTRLNEESVESMQTLQAIVELGRNAREKRNISLKTPVKSVVVILRNMKSTIVESLTGPLKSYILSELNAWDFSIVNKADEQNWVTLSLTPDFSLLGKKLGPKMKSAKDFITNMSHVVRL